MAITQFKQPEPPLDRFHNIDPATGKVKGVRDYSVFEHIKAEQPMFFQGQVLHVYKDGFFKKDTSGNTIKTMIRNLIDESQRKAPVIKRVYDLFTMDAGLEVTDQQINQYPPSWICFENGFFDPRTGEMHPHSPKYMCVNQIPYTYDPDSRPEGDLIEQWLTFAIPDPADREMFLEFAGYCMTRDTAQQKFLLLHGEGGTGKSLIVKMVQAMVGLENASHVPLDKLQERFSTFDLVHKLLNCVSDLKISTLEDVSVLKGLTGEDSMRAEGKNKDAFSFNNYSKLLFSMNELPTVRGERTSGFYRRLMLLKIDSVPEREDPELFDKLQTQMPYFIKICVEALQRMYQREKITVSDHSTAEVEQMRQDSDTVQAFIDECCTTGTRLKADRTDLYGEYTDFCKDADREPLRKTAFFKAMRSKGFTEFKSHGVWYLRGIFYGQKFPKSSPDGEKIPPKDEFNPLIEEEETPFD